jgi:CheY-like chemotaxis protein
MRRILYIEDNEDNVAMLKLRLEMAGYEVLVAATGAQGIAMTRTERPDVVLMDLDLPDIDGWEATKRLRDDDATRGIPVIALSAHAMPDHQARAMSAGCDDYEAKPVDLPRLIAKIERLASSGNA